MYRIQLFFLLYTSIIIAASENNDIKKLVSVVDAIKDMARKYMKAELAACNDLPCIEKLLYQEENNELKLLFDEYRISRYNRYAFYKQWARTQASRPLSRKSVHEQFQDKKGLGAALVDKTREFLAQNDVDPNAVQMIKDNEFFKKKRAAQGYAGGTTRCPCIAYDVDGINGMKIDATSEQTIAHEVTHVAELHRVKTQRIDHLLDNAIYKTKMYKASASKNYLDWTKAHEKQAELFPLLRMNNAVIDRQVFNDHFPHCLQQYNNGTLKQNLHRSRETATHPGCSELLPYMVRIEDIKRRDQKNAKIL